MLNKLPLEIIYNVTTFLTFSDKLTMSLTCKKLQALIWTNTLFQDLSLNGTSERVEAVFEKFKTKELNGCQVKQLTITSNEMPNEVFRELAIVFPNVTKLNDNFSHGVLGEMKDYDILKELLPWKYKLQNFNMSTDYSPFVHLIERDVFPNLKYLSISPHGDISEQFKPVERLFQCLANTPLLTHLRLYYMSIRIEFLEKLHSQCAQLQSLTLGVVIIDTRYDVEFTSVEPNTQLLSFEVENEAIICDHRCLLLDYIVTKYRRLEKLRFLGGFKEDWDSESISEYGNSMEISLLNQMGYVIHSLLDLNEIATMERINELLEAMAENHKMTRREYAKNGSRRLSKLPPTLKDLNVSTEIFKDLPEALEKADIQPRTLHLAVFQSLQAIEFFQKWTLLTKAYIIVPSDFNPSNGHVISNSITTLGLYSSDEFDHQEIYIDRILASFPSLEKLILNHGTAGPHSSITLCADEYETFPDTLYVKLRHLFIRCSMFHPTAAEFFVQCVPNLNRLRLDIIVNEKSWLFQREFGAPAPVNSVYLDGVVMEKLYISYSTQFDSSENSHSDDYSEAQDYEQAKGKAFLMVHNDGHVDHYTFRKDSSKRLVDFCSVNAIEVDDRENRIRLFLSHTGTIKEMSIDGNII